MWFVSPSTVASPACVAGADADAAESDGCGKAEGGTGGGWAAASPPPCIPPPQAVPARNRDLGPQRAAPAAASDRFTGLAVYPGAAKQAPITISKTCGGTYHVRTSAFIWSAAASDSPDESGPASRHDSLARRTEQPGGSI